MDMQVSLVAASNDTTNGNDSPPSSGAFPPPQSLDDGGEGSRTRRAGTAAAAAAANEASGHLLVEGSREFFCCGHSVCMLRRVLTARSREVSTAPTARSIRFSASRRFKVPGYLAWSASMFRTPRAWNWASSIATRLNSSPESSELEDEEELLLLLLSELEEEELLLLLLPACLFFFFFVFFLDILVRVSCI
jgi:hypothetical protein